MIFVGDKHHGRLKFERLIVAHRRAKILVKALGLGRFEDHIVVALQHIVMGHIRLKPIPFFDQRGTSAQYRMTPFVGKPKQHNLRHTIAFRQADRVGELRTSGLVGEDMQAMPTILADVEGNGFFFFGAIHSLGIGWRDRAGLGSILPRFSPDYRPKTNRSVMVPCANRFGACFVI